MNLWRAREIPNQKASRGKIHRGLRDVGISVVIVGFTMAFIGCGGGGSGGGPNLSPHEIIRSSALATYQSTAALTVYPIEALIASAPAGSNLVTASASPAAVAKSALRPSSLSAFADTDPLPLVNHSGLYSSGPKATSSGAVVQFYTDPTGTNPAGTMNIVSATKTFKYVRYPAEVDMSVKVTAGDLPCQGDAKIIWQSANGACEFSGTLQLLKNHETVTYDLSISDDHQVTGQFQVQENGLTIALTHVNGPFVGDQSLNFAISPVAYNGTGTIDLLSPTITLLFNDPDGASVSIDSTHHMVIHYPTNVFNGTDDFTEPIIDILIDTSGDDSDDGSSGGAVDDSSTGGIFTDGSATDGASTDGSTGSTDDSGSDGTITGNIAGDIGSTDGGDDGGSTDGSSTDGSSTDGSSTDGSSTDGSSTDGSSDSGGTDGGTDDSSTTGNPGKRVKPANRHGKRGAATIAMN